MRCSDDGTATIRFYAELNDLVPAPRRQRDTPLAFEAHQSVKDAMESLGVPHTEVDLILVNGASVGFSHRLHDGDRISVYPVFERIDIRDATRVRPEPLRRIRFVADVHLGALARRLRLVGLDTDYERTRSDHELAAVSAARSRVLLSRDRSLLRRRVVTHGLLVRSDDPDDQLVEVVRRLHLVGHLRPFTRCPRCNGLLEGVAKEAVADRLPPATRTHVESFEQCSECDHIYWRGAHHHRLVELVERVKSEGSVDRG